MSVRLSPAQQRLRPRPAAPGSLDEQGQSAEADADQSVTVRVAVVVVTYNSAEVLSDCLTSLVDQGVELSAIVVVDNASADASPQIATAASAGLPVHTVAMGRNAGYAAAINAGIATLDLSSLDAVMVLNPDCRLTPGALARLTRVLGLPARAGAPFTVLRNGIAVPLLQNPDGSLQPSLRHVPTVLRALTEALTGSIAGRLDGLGELVTNPKAYRHPGPVAWATGAAMLLSAEMIGQIGPWDESFLLYSEETEYCLRASDSRWLTWFEPTAVVLHIGGEQNRNPTLAKLATVNRVRLFRRRHNVLHAAAYFLTVLFGEGLRAAMGRPTSKASFVALLRPSRRVRALAAAPSASAGS
jgi:N-acetylglucosaminyl-diphospho-decaprenol L-rhamnosyltransferase